MLICLRAKNKNELVFIETFTILFQMITIKKIISVVDLFQIVLSSFHKCLTRLSQVFSTIIYFHADLENNFNTVVELSLPFTV